MDDLPALSAEIIALRWPGELGSVQLEMVMTAVAALQVDSACEGVLVVVAFVTEIGEKTTKKIIPS